jgi:diguanylate cyclase (GGDEF)-like protein
VTADRPASGGPRPLLWWSVSGEGRHRLRVARLLVVAVGTLAAATVVAALPGAVRFVAGAPAEFWAISLLALVVDLPVYGRRERTTRLRPTLSVCFTFAIFLLWGAAPAIVVQALTVVAPIAQKQRPNMTVYLTSRLVLALAVAESVVALVGPRPIIPSGAGLTGRAMINLLLPATVWFVVSFGLLALARAVINRRPMRAIVQELRGPLLGTAAAVLLVSPLLTTMTGWWSVLVAVPLWAWNRLSAEIAEQEEQLAREPVTGLLTRRGLMLSIAEATEFDAIARDGARPFGIILLNIESVLTVNRLLGRDVYESIVSEAAHRMAATYGADRVGRLSGEAFVLFVPDLTEQQALAAAQHAAAVLRPEIEAYDVPFDPDPAAGVALSPRDGRNFNNLLLKAELAMREARRRGEPGAVYVRQAAESARRRLALVQELRAALRNPDRHGEIAVLYQPQIDVGTGGLFGVEALVRWNHPVWGPVRPDELIEAVEPSEVMHLLTRHVLDAVAAQLREWNEAGLRIRTAVNVSVQDLHQPGFADEVAAVLDSHRLRTSQLTIEITERMLITGDTRVSRAASEIAGLGMGLSLDDFGTGYASMQQLRMLPLTEVKIDKIYVSGIADSAADRAIVRSVHELAQALRVEVVAEGVEDERTVAELARLPGTIGQGYYFGHPMMASAVLDRWHRRA